MDKKFCLKHSSGEDIFLFTLRNQNGTEVSISNYGAIITSFKVKDRIGNFNDIVLGFDDVKDYLSEPYLSHYAYIGAACGRYANRIKDARIRIDDVEHRLHANMGNDILHGGKTGFDKKVWEPLTANEERPGVLEFKYISADGEESFPGNLDTTIRFELSENDELSYEFRSFTDKPTAVNLTHHSYFNLNNGSGTIEDHELKIPASNILAQDEGLVCNGEYLPVENTLYDFREFRKVRNDNGEFKGFDQCFEIDGKTKELSLVAALRSKQSGLCLQVFSTEPAVQLYTAQGMAKLNGKNSTNYGPFSGLCLETHKHPNAINIPHFPDTILRPGEKYFHQTIYRLLRED